MADTRRMHVVIPRQFHFESYTLDLTNCALLRGSEVVRLRPKAFDVLRYLAERPGCLVAKDELIRAVWPGIFVSDDSLVQCIVDIRSALADDAHRIIKTVPRRGYLFASELRAQAAIPPAGAGKHALPHLASAAPAPVHRYGSRIGLVAALLALAVVGAVWQKWSEPPSSADDGSLVATASEGPTAISERRVALVIGNRDYGSLQLANTQHDADAVAGALRRIGFAQVTVERDASRKQTDAALSAFALAAKDADWAVVYFAGRGLELDGRSYLVPVDAAPMSPRDVAREAVALDEILRTTSEVKKVRIVIFDACRENPFAAGSGDAAGGIAPLGKDPPSAGGPRATLIAYATRHGATAEDGAGYHGPFAAALVKNLDTPGLEIGRLFRNVRDEVMASTNGRQEPFIYGSLPVEAFYFQERPIGSF